MIWGCIRSTARLTIQNEAATSNGSRHLLPPLNVNFVVHKYVYNMNYNTKQCISIRQHSGTASLILRNCRLLTGPKIIANLFIWSGFQFPQISLCPGPRQRLLSPNPRFAPSPVTNLLKKPLQATNHRLWRMASVRARHTFPHAQFDISCLCCSETDADTRSMNDLPLLITWQWTPTHDLRCPDTTPE